jgi:hypothetical protein
MAFLLSRIGLVRPRSEIIKIKIKSNQIPPRMPITTPSYSHWGLLEVSSDENIVAGMI